MATYTTNLHLTKPASDENYNVSVQNGNMDTLDTAVGSSSSITVTRNDDNISSGSTISAKKYGRVINVWFGVTPLVSSGNLTNIGTLPSGNRPAEQLFFPVITGGATDASHSVLIGTVQTGGGIGIYKLPDTLPYVRGNFTFII